MIHPDSKRRVDGTSYPDDDRAPQESRPLGGRRRSFKEVAASLLCRAGVVLLRPEPGDVLVVVNGIGLPGEHIGRINQEARRAGLHSAVFLPPGVRVHTEPKRLASEDRGYRESKTYGEDAEGRNRDRGVWIGTPEDVPDPCNG